MNDAPSTNGNDVIHPPQQTHLANPSSAKTDDQIQFGQTPHLGTNVNTNTQLPAASFINPVIQGVLPLTEWNNVQGAQTGLDQGQQNQLVSAQQMWPQLLQTQQLPVWQQVNSQTGQQQQQQQQQQQHQQQQGMIQPFAWASQVPAQYPFILAVLQAQAQVQQALGGISQPQNAPEMFNLYQNQGGIFAAGTPVNALERNNLQVKQDSAEKQQDQQAENQPQQEEHENAQTDNQFEKQPGKVVASGFQQYIGQGQQMQLQDVNGDMVQLQPIINAPIEQQVGTPQQVAVIPQQFADLWKQQAAAAAGVPQNASFDQNPATPVSDEREAKRQKRKQSNRESARRSRQRKQEEVRKLGVDVHALSAEKEQLSAQINEAQEMLSTMLEERQILIDKIKSLGGTVDDIDLTPTPISQTQTIQITDSQPIQPMQLLPIQQSPNYQPDFLQQPLQLQPGLQEQVQAQVDLQQPSMLLPVRSTGLSMEQQAILQSMQLRGIPRTVPVESMPSMSYQPIITSTDTPLPPTLVTGQVQNVSPAFVGTAQVTSGAVGTLPMPAIIPEGEASEPQCQDQELNKEQQLNKEQNHTDVVQ